ncbi:MAG: SDR family NAD(P)-dependent oxidoreductase [Actinomycetota bacterium]
MSSYIVTGASSGIGRATAVALAERGASVLAIARRVGPLAELAAGHPGLVQTLAADLATEEGLAALVERAAALADTDGIDGVVHAAGSLVPVEPYGELDSDALTDHFRVHVATPIEINNRLADQLRGGRVVYIDSFSAASPRAGWSAYSIVKAAAQMAARAASQELDDVHVVRIFPGGVRTPLVDGVLADRSSPVGDVFRELQAAGELAEPDDVGRYIARIATEMSTEELRTTEFWEY